MEIKISKAKGGLVLEGNLPPELVSAQAAELFPLRDGLFLLSVKGALEPGYHPHPAAQTASSTFSEQEQSVLRKLSAVKFERRTPAESQKMLSSSERQVLQSLMDKGLVRLFQSGKYEKEGVLSITDRAYSLSQGRQPQMAAPISPSRPQHAPDQLESLGWMVLESEGEARSYGNSNPEKIKSGTVLGIRAFDKKYYFVTKSYLEAWAKKIQLSLAKSEKTPEEIGAEIGAEPQGVRAILFHLCESGEAMEKQKGRFARA